MPCALSIPSHLPAAVRRGDQQNVSRRGAAVVAGNVTSSRTTSSKVVVAKDIFSSRGRLNTLLRAVALLHIVDQQTLAVVGEAAQDLLLCPVSNASLVRGADGSTLDERVGACCLSTTAHLCRLCFHLTRCQCFAHFAIVIPFLVEAFDGRCPLGFQAVGGISHALAESRCDGHE